MNRDKQIEEMTCKDCLHYEVCVYVNAKAVEFARAENCKLFADKNGYRKASDVAREIICDIVDPVWRAYENSENEMTSLLAAFICEHIATKIKQKYESEGADDEDC